jgi:hypothetical protein
MPPVICRHGVKIREAWWECGNCVTDNGLTRQDLQKLKSDHERQKRESETREREQYWKEKPERDRGLAKQQILLCMFWLGFWAALLTGFVGCIVTLAVSPRYTLIGCCGSAVIGYFLVVCYGFYDAYRIIKGK